MTQRSNKLHLPAKDGDNVIISMPSVDRAKSDLRNILKGVVTETIENEFHKIGAKFGLLDQAYARYVKKNTNYINSKLRD